MPTFVCSLGNADADPKPPPRELVSDSADAIEAFFRQWDGPDRGGFFCPNELVPGAATRSKKTILLVAWIYVDIDTKDIVEPLEVIDQRLAALPLLPTRVVNSGHGRHVYYRLAVPLDGQDEEAFAQAETLQKRLLEYLGADPTVSHPAALLRQVGTHNTKDGGNIPVTLLIDRGIAHHFEDIKDWLDDAHGTLFTRKGKTTGNGAATADDDCWGQFGEQKEPVDVAARLASVQHQGPGDTAVHITERDCMASLLARGVAMPEAIATVLDAVMSKYPNWNRSEEERGLRKLGETFLTKFPDVCERHEWDPKGNPKPKPDRKHNNRFADFFKLARLPDPATIPRRGWLYDNHYMTGAVTMTCAPGGTGKSIIALAEAVAMVSGRPILGEAPARPLKVLVWNGEETPEEQEVRLAAICQHHGIAREELYGRLFMVSGFEFPLRFARMKKGTAELEEDDLLLFFDGIEEHQIDIATLDPLISTHEIDENNNGHMDLLIKKGFGVGCNRVKCNIELPCHTRKTQNGSTEYTVEDVRGGSAGPNAARSVRLIRKMTPTEARDAGIDPIYCGLYLHMENGKSNYTAPGASSRWIHLVTVTMPSGERVGVPELYEVPDKLDGTNDADAEWARGAVVQNDYRKDPQAKDWFGKAVAKRLNLNVHDDRDKSRIKRVIKGWLATRVLSTEERRGEDRHTREYLCPGSKQ
jgi:AAA domain